MHDVQPCRHCGSTNLENLDAAASSPAPVVCITCGAQGPRRGIVNGLAAWNAGAGGAIRTTGELLIAIERVSLECRTIVARAMTSEGTGDLQTALMLGQFSAASLILENLVQIGDATKVERLTLSFGPIDVAPGEKARAVRSPDVDFEPLKFIFPQDVVESFELVLVHLGDRLVAPGEAINGVIRQGERIVLEVRNKTEQPRQFTAVLIGMTPEE